MADNKTRQTGNSVDAFIASIGDDTKRADAEVLLELMHRVTGDEPAMWGSSIIGFGHQRMVYDSGREVDWFHAGFSPRTQTLTLYIMDGFERHEPLLRKLGKHSTGKSCLYIKRLEQVDMNVLEELVTRSVAHVRTLGD